MLNPITQTLNARRMNPQNSILSLIAKLKSGNPAQIYEQMLNSNPQFKDFVSKNKGKTPEQIARENGIDINIINQFLR